MRIGRARSRLVTVALTALAAVGLTIGTAAPASASAWHELRYVALGDSYAAGQASDCTHTASSYPLLLDRLPSIKLVSDVSCAGATTTTVTTSQIGAVNLSVNLVTVTVGANDLDVAGLEAVCAANPASAPCAAAIQARQAQLPALFANLAAMYSLIAQASPGATILVDRLCAAGLHRAAVYRGAGPQLDHSGRGDQCRCGRRSHPLRRCGLYRPHGGQPSSVVLSLGAEHLPPHLAGEPGIRGRDRPFASGHQYLRSR